MSTKNQVILIGILFLGLILLSAGVGALAAGELVIGLLLLAGGVIFIAVAIMIFYYLRKQSRDNSV